MPSPRDWAGLMRSLAATRFPWAYEVQRFAAAHGVPVREVEAEVRRRASADAADAVSGAPPRSGPKRRGGRVRRPAGPHVRPDAPMARPDPPRPAAPRPAPPPFSPGDTAERAALLRLQRLGRPHAAPDAWTAGFQAPLPDADVDWRAPPHAEADAWTAGFQAPLPDADVDWRLGPYDRADPPPLPDRLPAASPPAAGPASGAAGAVAGLPEAAIGAPTIDYGFLAELLADSRRFAITLAEGGGEALEIARAAIDDTERAFWSGYDDAAAKIGGGVARAGGSGLDAYALDILDQHDIHREELAAVSLITDRRMQMIDERAGVIAADVARRAGTAAEGVRQDAIEHLLAISQVQQAQAQIDAANRQNEILEADYRTRMDMYVADRERYEANMRWLLEGSPEQIAAKMAALQLAQQAAA